MIKRIPYINLSKQINQEKKEIFKSFNKLFSSGQFVLGDEVDKFEKKICNFLKVKNCVALNSGTDALVLGMYLLGIKRGDEIYTTNSFIASQLIAHLGQHQYF